MRVTDRIKDCVAFLGLVNDREQFVPYGTGFFIIWTVTGMGYPYIVTARHVIEQIPGDLVCIRIHQKDGSLSYIRSPKRHFIYHPDHDPKTNYIDVAACVFGNATPTEKFTWVRENELVDANLTEKFSIGIGDEVIISGLLFSYMGETKNIPVVRLGSVAAMREEPFPTDYGPMDAYLTEVRSINGLSGSPVFLQMMNRPASVDGKPVPNPGRSHLLLGLVHGHYSVNSQQEIVASTAPAPPDVNSTAKFGEMNTGIAIIVPADKIREMLDQPAEVLNRETWVKKFLPKTSDAASAK